MEDALLSLVFLLLAASIYVVDRIERYGWFRVTSRWSRKMDRKIEDMLTSDEFYCRQDHIASDFACGISDNFRRDCLGFLHTRRKARRGKSDVEWLERYYFSDAGFYTMVATRAYRKLLFSPLALYSQLGWEEQRAYRCIYRYAVEKLVNIGCYDLAFCEKAERQLTAIEEFCEAQKREGNFVEW